MNKIFCSTILFFGLSLSLFSQTETIKDTLYLDVDNLKISKTTFNKKFYAAVFYSRAYYLDGIVINKISYQYYFGKITPQKRKELQILINSKTNRNIKDNENILIQYFDTLQGYQGQKRLYKKHYIDYHYQIVENDTIYFTEYPPLTLKKFNTQRKKYQKKLTKCSIKLEKRKNTKVIEMYNIDTGYPFELEKLTWLKDPGIFKKIFFKNMYESNLLIIKPNGDYFMKYSHIKDEDLFGLLKTDDWSQYKKDFEKSINTNSSVGYGIIKSLHSIYNGAHPKHCY